MNPVSIYELQRGDEVRYLCALRVGEMMVMMNRAPGRSNLRPIDDLWDRAVSQLDAEMASVRWLGYVRYEDDRVTLLDKELQSDTPARWARRVLSIGHCPPRNGTDIGR